MNKIITISREFGSGGRELGKRLADELDFDYYDKEIISEIAKETGMSEEYITSVSEKGVQPYALQFARSFSSLSNIQSNQINVLVAEQKVLKEIAKKGNAVIVGGGASVILKEYDPMSIFVYATMEAKINRCKMKREDEKLSDKEIENNIKKIDKNRKSYHKIISNLEWGEKENYNLCINTTGVEIKNLIPSLADYIEEWFSKNN